MRRDGARLGNLNGLIASRLTYRSHRSQAYGAPITVFHE
jgi:hypothetical protein